MIVVDTLAVALEMALAGRGVALMNGPFADDDLASGRLVRAYPHELVCPGAWGLICRADQRDQPRLKLFMDWLKASVEPPRASPGVLAGAAPTRRRA